MHWNRMFRKIIAIIHQEVIRLVILTSVACIVAIGFNLVSPDAMDWIRKKNPSKKQELSLEQVVFHIQNQSALLVDARSAATYAKGHVAGALNVSSAAKEFHFSESKGVLKKANLIIIYCSGMRCKQSETVYRYLMTQGLSDKKLRLYPGGWEMLGTNDAIPKQTGEQP